MIESCILLLVLALLVLAGWAGYVIAQDEEEHDEMTRMVDRLRDEYLVEPYVRPLTIPESRGELIASKFNEETSED